MTLPHEKLVAWQRADDLFIAIYRLTSTYPADERFGILRRSDALRTRFRRTSSRGLRAGRNLIASDC
jgi:hypothetical protein